MIMYKCKDCGNLFEDGEEKVVTESYGQEFSSCPSCGGDYEKVEPCAKCGAFGNVEKGLCLECRFTTITKFRKFMDTEFSLEEREWLNRIYDGEWI